MGKSTISMAIFNSYVSSPEVIRIHIPQSQNHSHTRPELVVLIGILYWFEQRNLARMEWRKWRKPLQDVAPKIAKLPYKWLYGRYNL